MGKGWTGRGARNCRMMFLITCAPPNDSSIRKSDQPLGKSRCASLRSCATFKMNCSCAASLNQYRHGYMSISVSAGNDTVFPRREADGFRSLQSSFVVIVNRLQQSAIFRDQLVVGVVNSIRKGTEMGSRIEGREDHQRPVSLNNRVVGHGWPYGVQHQRAPSLNTAGYCRDRTEHKQRMGRIDSFHIVVIWPPPGTPLNLLRLTGPEAGSNSIWRGSDCRLMAHISCYANVIDMLAFSNILNKF